MRTAITRLPVSNVPRSRSRCSPMPAAISTQSGIRNAAIWGGAQDIESAALGCGERAWGWSNP